MSRTPLSCTRAGSRLDVTTRVTNLLPSWSLAHDIVRQEWAHTLVVWSQLLRLPFKAVGGGLYVVVRAIGLRFDPVYT